MVWGGHDCCCGTTCTTTFCTRRRYDPYPRQLTRERYDHAGMQAARRAAIEAATGARSWGLVLGTLGRQGNPRILAQLRTLLERQGRPYVTVLLSGGWVGGQS